MPKLQAKPPLSPPKKQKKLKKLLKEAEAIAKGTELGKYKAHSKKPWQESLKEHLGHWIDGINPLDLAAICATTYLIHGVVITSTTLMQTITNYVTKTPEGIGLIFGSAVAPFFGIPGIVVHYLQQMINISNFSKTEQNQIKAFSQTTDFMIWIVSFALAYILIKHGGALIGMLGSEAGSISKIVGLMLA